jgi:methylmalonyl-CoA/ethylmalonyl-CoA epimerase
MSSPDAGEGCAPGGAATYDHVAVAARRLRDLLPLYRDTLGGRFVQGGDNLRVGYRALQLEVPGGGVVELIEPLAGSTFLDGFFSRFPAGGVHHVTFHVPDIEVVLPRMRGLGLPLTGLYLDDIRYREVFVHPRDAFGVLLQIVDERRSREAADPSMHEVLAGVGGNGIPSP